MNKNLNHKGASKRKGAAESEELTEKGPVDGMDEGMAKKKGAAQAGYEAIIQHGKDLKKARDKASQKDLNNRFNAGILDSINMEHSGQGDKAKETYGKNYGQISNPSGEDKKKKYLGEKDFVEPSAEALKSYMDFKLPGASRMGFTQNFGAARQNGYAKGAAKVASIMNFGAAKAKGAAEYGGKKGDDSKSKKDYEK
jgi:hypothetical protein